MITTGYHYVCLSSTAPASYRSVSEGVGNYFFYFSYYIYRYLINVLYVLIYYIQAYIGSFSLYPNNTAATTTTPTTTTAVQDDRELTLILMASSADPLVFKELLRGKKYLEKVSFMGFIIIVEKSSIMYVVYIFLVLGTIYNCQNNNNNFEFIH